MPSADAPPVTRGVVLRGIGFAFAIAAGAVAVWLIVTGAMSVRRIEVGVIVGLWGLLLGAFSMFGARRAHSEAIVLAPGVDLERRAGSGVEPIAQAEARRAFEERLEHLLRTEISNSVNREVGDLRREVASLRQELLEKVGGQLRLERIETTRLIGSDLEALQHEVRALKSARDSIPATVQRPDPLEAVRSIDAQATAERQRADEQRAAAARAATERAAAERAAAEWAAAERAEWQRAEQERSVRERAQREQAQREQAQRERAQREQAKAEAERVAQAKAEAERVAQAKAEAERQRVAQAKAEAERVAQATAAAELAAKQREHARQQEQAAATTSSNGSSNGASDDPFASMPRITPFTDFALDPVDQPRPSARNGHRPDGDADDKPSYTGRRRATDGEDIARRSRHAANGADDGPDADEAPVRRHRADDEDAELLSKLLARENVEH